MTLIITLTQRNDGADCAKANGFTVISRHGATMDLARILSAAGLPDQPWQACWPDGRLRFRGPSLRESACFTITESGNGPKLRRIANAKAATGPVGGLKSQPGEIHRAKL